MLARGLGTRVRVSAAVDVEWMVRNSIVQKCPSSDVVAAVALEGALENPTFCPAWLLRIPSLSGARNRLYQICGRRYSHDHLSTKKACSFVRNGERLEYSVVQARPECVVRTAVVEAAQIEVEPLYWMQ